MAGLKPTRWNNQFISSCELLFLIQDIRTGSHAGNMGDLLILVCVHGNFSAAKEFLYRMVLVILASF